MANSIHIAASVPFQWHPEVWLLVSFLTGAYIYMVRVIGPKAVGPGEPVVTRTNIVTYSMAMVLLWVSGGALGANGLPRSSWALVAVPGPDPWSWVLGWVLGHWP